MRLTLVDHHAGGRRDLIEGAPDEVRAELLARVPWLVRRLGRHATVEAYARELDRTQAFTAVVHDGDLVLKTEPAVPDAVVAALLGHDHQHVALGTAAAFLAGTALPDAAAWRRGLLEHDEDPERAALAAVGLPVTPAYLLALRGVCQAALTKMEVEPKTVAIDPADVTPTTPEGQGFAAAVARAAKAQQVHPVKLGGKHSTGALVAEDPEGHTKYLLKPGS